MEGKILNRIKELEKKKNDLLDKVTFQDDDLLLEINCIEYAINELIQLVSNSDERFSVTWSVSDFIVYAKDEKEITLSMEDAKECIRQLRKNYSGSIGVTWEIIDYIIDDVLKHKKEN